MIFRIIRLIIINMMQPPKTPSRDSRPILCPRCFRRTYYIFKTDQYECVKHGVVVTTEDLYNFLVGAHDFSK